MDLIISPLIVLRPIFTRPKVIEYRSFNYVQLLHLTFPIEGLFWPANVKNVLPQKQIYRPPFALSKFQSSAVIQLTFFINLSFT